VTRKQSRESIAYHEAGHAVIPRVLTLACGGATITANPWACLSEWEKRGKVRFYEDAVWHARLMSYMAGAEAEAEILGRTPVGDCWDRGQIELMAEELCHSPPWDKMEPRLRAKTRMLVRRHRDKIERVAKALLAKTTLTAKEIDKLVGRSVDDVKVNAPFLLERHRIHQLERVARDRN